MICREILKEIEARLPKHYAMEWDNVGLQVGRSDKEVKRIYLALDATDEVIEEAADWGADMLITHHPMIFKAMKKINDEDFIGRRVLKLIRDDISYYAMHRLGVFPGSGKSAISVSLEKGVDVLVTGDIDHHEGIDAVAQKMAVIDAGHYGVEHIFIADMEHFCREKFPEAEIRTAKIRQPFWVLT